MERQNGPSGFYGYLIVFGKPGEPENTVTGASVKEALDDLVRNMTQLGLFRDAVSAQLADDLQRAFGKAEKQE
jgi:hypothetical protein